MPNEDDPVPRGLDIWNNYNDKVIASASFDEFGKFAPRVVAMHRPSKCSRRPSVTQRTETRSSASRSWSARPRARSPPPRCRRARRPAIAQAPPVAARRPLAALDPNVLTLARQIGALEAEKEALQRRNARLENAARVGGA